MVTTRSHRRLFLFLTAGSLACTSGQDAIERLFRSEAAWVDLTHSFNAAAIYWPTAEPFRLEVQAAGMTDGGYYYAANNFAAAEHGGTHLDAPIHFSEGSDRVEEIPLMRLIGPAVVVDVAARAATNPNYLIASADFESFEAAHGPIPMGAIVLLRTGWGQHWSDRASYLGTEATGEDAVPLLRFPGLAPEAARWLAEVRRVGAVGIDTPSIDRGQSTTFESHQILYGSNIPGFENVANLEAMPETGGYVIALPMKIEGGSGARLRIVGVVPGRG